MDNWYYVVGSDRVGPVTINALKVLFSSGEITNDTYVWKKGFQNWERLKDAIGDLISAPNEDESPQVPASAPVVTKKAQEENVVNSPEVNFSFSWNSVKENEELFFARIGKDRKGLTSDIYGPYSLVELKEALKARRINLQTSIFAPGLNSWTKIQDTPLNENFKGTAASLTLSELPLLLVFSHSPSPLVTVVKKAGVKNSVLLGARAFDGFQNKTLKASLYVGSEIKIKNVQVKIESYDKKEQSIECQLIDLEQDAKKIMLNHAV